MGKGKGNHDDSGDPSSSSSKVPRTLAEREARARGLPRCNPRRRLDVLAALVTYCMAWCDGGKREFGGSADLAEFAAFCPGAKAYIDRKGGLRRFCEAHHEVFQCGIMTGKGLELHPVDSSEYAAAMARYHQSPDRKQAHGAFRVRVVLRGNNQALAQALLIRSLIWYQTRKWGRGLCDWRMSTAHVVRNLRTRLTEMSISSSCKARLQNVARLQASCDAHPLYAGVLTVREHSTQVAVEAMFEEGLVGEKDVALVDMDGLVAWSWDSGGGESSTDMEGTDNPWISSLASGTGGKGNNKGKAQLRMESNGIGDLEDREEVEGRHDDGIHSRGRRLDAAHKGETLERIVNAMVEYARRHNLDRFDPTQLADFLRERPDLMDPGDCRFLLLSPFLLLERHDSIFRSGPKESILVVPPLWSRGPLPDEVELCHFRRDYVAWIRDLNESWKRDQSKPPCLATAYDSGLWGVDPGNYFRYRWSPFRACAPQSDVEYYNPGGSTSRGARTKVSMLSPVKQLARDLFWYLRCFGGAEGAKHETEVWKQFGMSRKYSKWMPDGIIKSKGSLGNAGSSGSPFAFAVEDLTSTGAITVSRAASYSGRMLCARWEALHNKAWLYAESEEECDDESDE